MEVVSAPPGIHPRNLPDVPSDYWSYKHIECCVEYGAVNGYGGGTYQPCPPQRLYPGLLGSSLP